MQNLLRNIIRGAPRSNLSRRMGLRNHPQVSRILSIFLALVIVLGAVVFGALPQTTMASNVDLLMNGNFESGFGSQPGCGMVGSSWRCFTNAGAVNYGFYDDQWELTRADGAHSQLIEINTKGVMAPDHDRYAGIYQTVRVVDWAEYTLSLRGMIRTTVKDGDPYRYRVQVGWSSGPHANWGAVTNWQDVGWNVYYDRLTPGKPNSYSTSFMAEDDYITVYIRAWKKWGVLNEEIDVNLDAISLTGPTDAYAHPWPMPADNAEPDHAGGWGDSHPSGGPAGDGYGDHSGYHQASDHQPDYDHAAAKPTVVSNVCTDMSLVHNGSFEQGFNPVAVGHVGKSWGYFTNDGAANYGFYDEKWGAVIADGAHGQLIEINTKGINPADGDRYAGIYQHIDGLQPGKTYELIVKGMIRGAGDETDPYRFQAQWGFNVGGDTDWMHVPQWTGMDLGKIAPRLKPGNLATYTVRFTAPADHMVLFVRGWSKWGISELEMDLNLDAISVRGCDKAHEPDHEPDHGHPWPPAPPAACLYVVQPGDSLGMIAQSFGVGLHHLARFNDIANPNIIFVGQRIQIPDCGGQPPIAEPPPVDHYPPVLQSYTVQRGDTLSGIAAAFGVSMYDLAYCNGIANPDFVYVGQVLKIP